MSHFRKVDVKIWNDEKFMLLPKDSKLAFLFILTHPALTSLGAMRATVEGLAAELEVDVSNFDALIDAELVEFDRQRKIICLPNFLRYNKPENPNVVLSWGKSFDLLPESIIKTNVYVKAKEIVQEFGKGFQEAFMKAFPQRFHKDFGQELIEELSKGFSKTGAGAGAKEHLFEHFEEFWSAYPKKKNKGQARKTWGKLVKQEKLPSIGCLLSSIQNGKKSEDWKKNKGQYIPYPSTWLNAEGWLDEFTQDCPTGQTCDLPEITGNPYA